MYEIEYKTERSTNNTILRLVKIVASQQTQWKE